MVGYNSEVQIFSALFSLRLINPNPSPFFQVTTSCILVTTPHFATRYGPLLTLFFVSPSLLSFPHFHRCFGTQDSASAAVVLEETCLPMQPKVT